MIVTSTMVRNMDIII